MAVELSEALSGGAAFAIPQRLTVIGNRSCLMGEPSPAGGGATNYTRGESRYTFKTGRSGVRNIRLVYANFRMGPYEQDAYNDIQVEAALGVDTSPNETYPVFFRGRRWATIENGAGYVVSDPLGVYVAPNSTMIVRTGVLVNSGEQWPLGFRTSATSDTAVESTSASSQVRSTGPMTVPSGGASNSWGFGPVAILGEMDDPEPSVALVGDSIVQGFNANGTGGLGLGDQAGNFGLFGYGLASIGGYQMPYMKLSRGSETLQNAATQARGHRRVQLASYATHCVIALGTNDVSARSVAQMQTDFTTVFARYRQQVRKLYAAIIPPRTTSTDSFATTANQTPMAGWEVGGKRDQINTWLRAQVGTLIDGVVDYSQYVESPTTPGVWLPNYTADGTHPNETGAQAAKVAMSTLAATFTL